MTYAKQPFPWSRRDQRRPPALSEEQWMSRRAALRALGFGGTLGALNLLGCRGAPTAPGGDITEYAPSDRWVPDWDPAGP